MHSRKNILIFGAGVNQLELIRESKLLGITTVVIDPQENPPGKKETNYFYQVDGHDYETTRSIALKHNISGIVTGQMEKPLRLMARLAKDLGFIFNTPEVTERCIDKWLMKQSFIENNIPCAKGILISSKEESILSKIEGMAFPLIVKPRDAYSSRGVFKTETKKELLVYLNESRKFSTHRDVIIEEFLEGKEFSVETITYKGETTIIQFTEKFITPYPNTVEIAHLQPANLKSKEKIEIAELVKRTITSLNINNSAAHVELMFTKDGPKIIEIGARSGGDFIASYLTKASTGISMDKAVIQIAMGMKPDLTFTKKNYSYIRYLELTPGRKVKKVMPLKDLIRMDDIIFAYVFVNPGDIISALHHSVLRPGCIIVEGKSKKRVIEKTGKYLIIMNSLILTEN